MKKFVCLLCIVFIFGMVRMVESTLIDRGCGLIYDDVLDITWLQNANYIQTSGYDDDGYVTWDVAKDWVSQLNFQGYNDWRLPYIRPINGISFVFKWRTDGTTDKGYNVSAPGTPYEGSTQSEFAYMYYTNLGNKARYNLNGNERPEGTFGLLNTGPFINIIPDDYCSGVDNPSKPEVALNFTFSTGNQQNVDKLRTYSVWPVRDGDSSPIPEPSTMLLLCTALMGLVGLKKKFTF